jgi:hypothetical protein
MELAALRIAPAAGCGRVGDTLLTGEAPTGEPNGEDARPLHRNKANIKFCSESSKYLSYE